jgi:Family of unknown function (DUF5675)
LIIEDGYNAVKIKGSTRIPEGRYQLIQRRHGRIYEKMKSRWGHTWVVEVTNVPDYEGIIFHTGNTHEDTKGCPLTCMSFDEKENEVLFGNDSTEAYLNFINFMRTAFAKGEVWLNVTRDLMQIL